MKNSLALLIGVILFASCDASNFATADQTSIDNIAENSDMAQSASMEFEKQENAPADEIDLSKNRKMIWTADLKFQVKNVDTSTKAVQDLCSKYDGFISNMDFSSNSYQLSNQIEIRIANDNFEKLIAAFKDEATYVDELKIRSEDVTEEFVDIESRLSTKRDVRDRYIAVLRDKAGTVEDIIAAEEAIRVITEEIEVIEGRLRFLKDRINFSTITLTIYQKVEFSEKPSVYEKSYGSELTDGFNNGWSVVTGFIVVLANLWPVIVLLLLGLWKGKWLWRKLFGTNQIKS